MRVGSVRKNGEAMREHARSAEHPSESPANGLSDLLGPFRLIG